MTSTESKRRAFRALHERGCFVLPNPWDVGTAVQLERLGFQALATTSGGHAFSRGLPDGAVARDEVLAHVRELVAATALPVNADLEDGLVAYAGAGADCLYAPGLTTAEQISAVVAAVAPKPVNVLVSSPGHTVSGLAALGVRRISVGSTLARVAWTAFLRAAREIADRGTFDAFAGAESYAAMNELFRGGGRP
jgi:2-methylisocitrate lyase-like PEP mutase family enzyme